MIVDESVSSYNLNPDHGKAVRAQAQSSQLLAATVTCNSLVAESVLITVPSGMTVSYSHFMQIV